MRRVLFRRKGEIEKYFGDFRRSGLSATLFYQKNNLPTSTFSNWLKRGKEWREKQPSFARLICHRRRRYTTRLYGKI